MIIHTVAYPRAALIGNPSDGYFGKTIAFTFSNFQADVFLYQTPELEILPNQIDHSVFEGIEHLVRDVKTFGYYGGIRLLKAAVKKFYEYCTGRGIELDNRNFTIRYKTTIPNRLGLAGSSAIITACMRALMAFYSIEIPKPVLANLILSVEKDELGIAAGLQDRVAIVYQGLVYMDFDRAVMTRQGHGRYETMDQSMLPPLYIAYKADLSEGSEVVHNTLRSRYEKGDREVLAAIEKWKTLTEQVREALETGRGGEIGKYMDENFNLRRQVTSVSGENMEMVETARSVGASAKFTGSGGAIIGTYKDESMYRSLSTAMDTINVTVIMPVVAPPEGV